MKQTKRMSLTALILVFALVFTLLAGCGSTASTDDSSATDDSAATQATTAPAASDDEATAEPEDSYFPLSEDETTFQWYFEGTLIDGLIDSFSDVWCIQQLGELSNVYPEFITPAQGSESENFAIMISSGDLPEVIGDFYQRYTGSVDSAIEDGTILDLNDYVEEYMPDYLNAINSTITTDCYTDSGYLWGIHLINQVEQAPFTGNLIRQDWLDKYNLDVPVTFDDWEEALTAFTLEDTTKGPLYLLSNGFADQWMAFSYSYNAGLGIGTADLPWVQIDGEAVYSPITDGWYQYLEIMHKWYTEGLIYADFMSQTFMDAETPVTSSEVGIWCGMYVMVEAFEGMIGGDAEFTAFNSPVLNEGDEVHLRNYSDIVRTNYSAAVSGDIDDDLLPIVLKYFNYFFTDEGAELVNWGAEGVTFDYDESGERVLKDFIVNPETDDFTASEVLGSYVLMNAPVWYDYTRELGLYSERAVSLMDVWQEGADTAYAMPNLTLTSDESSTATNIESELSTYVSEYLLKVIVGETDLASTWDSYLNTLDNMGVNTVIGIYQDALDRYNAR